MDENEASIMREGQPVPLGAGSVYTAGYRENKVSAGRSRVTSECCGIAVIYCTLLVCIAGLQRSSSLHYPLSVEQSAYRTSL